LSNEDFEVALQSIQEQDAVLAEGLALLAKDFRFDLILELLG